MTVPYGHTGKTQHSTSIHCKTLLTSFFYIVFDILVAFLHVPWVQKTYDKLDYETLPVALSFVLIDYSFTSNGEKSTLKKSRTVTFFFKNKTFTICTHSVSHRNKELSSRDRKGNKYKKVPKKKKNLQSCEEEGFLCVVCGLELKVVQGSCF